MGDDSLMEKLLKGKNILVTGGTGSIGGEIVKQCLKYGPKVVRVYSRDESKQFEMQYELKDYSNVRFIIGDIRDKERLQRAIEDIDIAFHAAALKHVPACEYNPFEAVRTNVLGVQNLIDVAMAERKVEKVVTISTDKATHPTNTMGATKLLSEKLIAAANFYKGTRKTIFSCVRFGNVIGSRGSIIPFIRNQISHGGPVTITDKAMHRFVMSISQAVNLVLKSAEIAKGGEVFILKMPIVKIKDLIEVMIEQWAPEYGYNKEDIEVKTIGLRSGEKVHEVLMTWEEAARVKELEDMFILQPSWKGYPFTDEFMIELSESKDNLKEYSSDSFEPLSKDKIIDLLKEVRLM